MDNTIIVYTSDQGFYLGEHGWFDKRFVYDQSFKTPLLVAWPGRVKPGGRSDELVQNLDFAQTFLDAARHSRSFRYARRKYDSTAHRKR